MLGQGASPVAAATAGEGLRLAHEEFRQHYGFAALMVICGACLVYLMAALRSILQPFLWAFFLVMALSPAVALVERLLQRTAERFCQCCTCICACAACFCGYVGACCRRPGRRGCGGCCPQGWRSPARRRMLARDLPGPVPSMIGAVGWEDPPSAGAPGDVASPRVAHSPCASAGPRRVFHALAIVIVVAAVACSIVAFVLLVVQSVMSLKEHWNIYRDGARDVSKFLEREVGNVAGTLSQEMTDSIAQSTLRQAEDLVSTMVTRLLSNIWSSVLEFLMMVLYISFWLANPMPVGNKVEELFRRYILLKGLACAGYGICVGVLLSVLSVDLSAFFGLAAFLLSFVPEVGAFAAILLPMPVILFDSRQDAPGGTLALATGCQLMLKFVFANVVEVKLVEADRLMKMHPVIILLAVTFFGLIWGPTGMLLSVPFVAYLKVIVLSESVPALYRDPVLVVLEGDRGAPAKHARNHRHLEVEASAASSDSNHDGEDGGEDCGGTSAAPPASPRAELRGRRENATPERDRAACAA